MRTKGDEGTSPIHSHTKFITNHVHPQNAADATTTAEPSHTNSSLSLTAILFKPMKRY